MTLGTNVKDSLLYLVAREARHALARERASRQGLHRIVISLRPEHGNGEHALVCFRMEPFLQAQQGVAPDLWHPTMWLSFTMAHTLADLGYEVDVISQNNDDFWPCKRYAIVLDVRRVLERIAPLLDRTCLKMAHLDTAHTLAHDAAEARRLLNLQGRRGVSLTPVRFSMPTLALDHADCGTTSGHEFTLATYRYTGKPIYRLPIPSAVLHPWPEAKNFTTCRRRFLFLASHGLVHKGLDLLLEAFAAAPDLHLVVCAPVHGEPDFARAYRHELFALSNIETIGFVDISSNRFREIANTCAAMILPSCSEGSATSPVDAMHAGLIPIVTYESSVEVGEFGTTLKSDEIDDIKAAVLAIAELPASALEARGRAAWEHARARHTRPLFAEAFRRTIRSITGSQCCSAMDEAAPPDVTQDGIGYSAATITHDQSDVSESDSGFGRFIHERLQKQRMMRGMKQRRERPRSAWFN